MLHETIPTAGVLEWLAVATSVIAMIVATVVLSRSAARQDVIHEHELADVLTRGERPPRVDRRLSHDSLPHQFRSTQPRGNES